MNMEEPATLDPALSEDVISGAVIRAIFDGLVRLDKDGYPGNSVAANIKISDDKKIDSSYAKTRLVAQLITENVTVL